MNASYPKILLGFVFFFVTHSYGQYELKPGRDYVPGEVIVVLKPTSEKGVDLKREIGGAVKTGLQSLDGLIHRERVSELIESSVKDISEVAARRYTLKVPEG